MLINLEKGTKLTNQELCKVFGCSPQGGMRRSHETNSLVLIMNHLKSTYEDRWEGNTLFYTGMGQTGDQVLKGNQNITLYESNDNDITVHLFEVLVDKEYIYLGIVKLISTPFQDNQLDNEGNIRKVWLFPLELQDQSLYLSNNDLSTLQNKRQKKAKKTLSLELLREKALKQSRIKPGYRYTKTKTFQRSEYVIEYAKRKANGICDLCDEVAPFKDEDEIPYLEVHHIIPLSNGGSDTIDNVAALCPNCHRKMHVLGNINDIEKLKNR